MTDATTTALSLQEILQIICDHCDDSTLASCATVARTWEGPALCVLYNEFFDASHIFGLLGPLTDEQPYQFRETLGGSGWSRFQYYASFVRLLSFDHMDGTPDLDHTLVRDAWFIAAIHGESVLFPYLTHLECRIDTMRSLQNLASLFQPTIKTLNIVQFESQATLTAECLFQLISHRTPNLVDLTTENNVQSCVLAETKRDSISSSFSAMKHLKYLDMDSRILTCPSIFNVLQYLPDLEKLRHLYDHNYSPHYLEKSNIVFLPDSFPNLEELDLWISHEGAVSLFAQKAPESLKVLRFSLFGLENPKHFSCIAENIMKHGAQIEEIEIWCRDTVETFILSMDHFQCFLSSTHLTDLRIRTETPLDISDDNIRDMAMSLPMLGTLYLSPDPFYFKCRPSRLSLAALLPFAEFCKNLTHVGLFVDTDIPFVLPISYPTLPDLCSISFGFSNVGKKFHLRVALFLTSVFPGAEICHGTLSKWKKENKDSADVKAQSKKCAEDWGAVLSMIKEIKEHQRKAPKQEAI